MFVRGTFMAKSGDLLVNPVTGMQLRILQASSDTGGTLLEMEATYAPRSPEPPEHFHPNQDERFEILEGEMQVRLAEGVRTLAQGDSLDVPAGTRHSMWNAGTAAARVHWETRPALRTEQFFEEVFALAAERKVDSKGTPGLRHLADLLPKYAEEIRVTRPPALVQKLVFGVVRRLS